MFDRTIGKQVSGVMRGDGASRTIRRERLVRTARNLPKLQREIFLAHRLDDSSYDEIARRTGLTVRQVERHVAEALCKIARKIDGERLSWWERRF